MAVIKPSRIAVGSLEGPWAPCGCPGSGLGPGILSVTAQRGRDGLGARELTVEVQAWR